MPNIIHITTLSYMNAINQVAKFTSKVYESDKLHYMGLRMSAFIELRHCAIKIEKINREKDLLKRGLCYWNNCLIA